MPFRAPVEPEAFEAMKNVDIEKLSGLKDVALRPVLPCLVRMSLCAPLDTSEKWTQERKKILKCLSGIEVVNSLVGLLSIDFHALETDARKEQQLRSKLGGNPTESVLIAQLEQGLALEFERSDAARKLRLLLSELLFIMSQIKEHHTDFYHKTSELFESEVYLEEVSDVLCIAQAELPALLPVTDVAEALLHVTNGSWLLCRMVANVPDTFDEVCRSLVSNGEKQDEEGLGGQRWAEALRMLCEMCPSHALTIRALCVEHCRLPSLAVALTLHHSHDSQSEDSAGSQSEESLSDVVAFVSGLLLGSDVNVRNWFAQFIRIGQKRRESSSMLHALRQELLEQLIMVLPEGTSQVTDRHVVQGCAFIRLYCALRGIAAMRFTDEENHVLLRLVTCRAPPTAGGVRIICLGLSMLLACPYLLGTTEQERRAIDWIKWLVAEAAHFEKETGSRASFAEMLLLISIHFHSNQNSAIAELVNSTLGMKSVVKANSLARMKTIFTQEIFTDEVVTSHAIRVPVTVGLNADMPGYLPIHCIYQLIKSRAFSKHKVPIKDWIYKQICTCQTPVHPLVPNLIETYINSVIVPSSKSDRTNTPITEQEILSMFQDTVLSRHSRLIRGQGQDQEEAMETDQGGEGQQSKFTAQILLVYYVLLYQDILLNNMKNIVTWNRKVSSYSQQLVAQLPMKSLLQTAQKQQHLYAGLFAPLLRLLVTHYPHLSLVEDWMDEELTHPLLRLATLSLPGLPCTPENLDKAFSEVSSKPTQALILLEKLSLAQGQTLLPFVNPFLGHLPQVLDPGVPRKIATVCKKVWLKLNTVMPTRLRVMTVNALRDRQNGAYKSTPYTEDEITLDPLTVLRCDARVFRCPPMLEITLRVLNAFLQASRLYLNSHLQSNPPPQIVGTIQQATAAKEELKNALVAAQESAVIQILLECCLQTEDRQAEDSQVLSDLREVQGLVCSHVHQMFIAEPSLAKLVHFQGYPRELLPLAVAGVPSMHICLDFIPELLAQPHFEKQMFAIELVSYLSQQYALPKSLGVARLSVNVLNTLLSVMPRDSKPDLLMACLPALVRIARTFPPLCDDIIALLTQIIKVCNSHVSVTGHSMANDVQSTKTSAKENAPGSKLAMKCSPSADKYHLLAAEVKKTFTEIVSSTATLKHQSHFNSLVAH